MNKRAITKILILLILSANLFYVSPVYARNPFKDFLRGIKRGTRFVVNLPNKATRWMGPILGPIAADILTQNIIKNPNIGRIFRRAAQIDKTIKNVEDQKKYLDQVKKNFSDQATSLKNEAQDIRKLRQDLGQQLVNGQLTFDQYKQQVIALDNIADSYDLASDKFRQAADKIEPANLTRMLTRNVWQQMLRQIRNGVGMELKNELNKFIKPEVIESLVSRGNLSFDQLIDILVSGDLSAIIAQNKNIDSNDLRNRVRDRIKDILKDNKLDLRNNWQQKIRQIIDEEVKKLEKIKKNLPTVAKEEKKVEPTQPPQSNKQQGKCPAGYEFCPRCGIECRQKNCNEISSGHWDYTGHCVCGSSGSIAENPKDPNKECYYPAENKSCPGCLYACVHFEEECPKAK